jgi:hypothetical protein
VWQRSDGNRSSRTKELSKRKRRLRCRSLALVSPCGPLVAMCNERLAPSFSGAERDRWCQGHRGWAQGAGCDAPARSQKGKSDLLLPPCYDARTDPAPPLATMRELTLPPLDPAPCYGVQTRALFWEMLRCETMPPPGATRYSGNPAARRSSRNAFLSSGSEIGIDFSVCETVSVGLTI